MVFTARKENGKWLFNNKLISNLDNEEKIMLNDFFKEIKQRQADEEASRNTAGGGNYKSKPLP